MLEITTNMTLAVFPWDIFLLILNQRTEINRQESDRKLVERLQKTQKRKRQKVFKNKL